ncbi:hypothetical protein BDV12DRAFT_199424 [Aspergillus spectabilis]
MHSTTSPLLVDDIWYILIDILSHPPPADDSDYEENYDDRWRPKKLDKVVPYLRDLINLSSSCKWLRDLLAPRIFGSLYLYNTAKSALSIQAIAKGKHSGYVQSLHYIAACEQDQQNSPLEQICPPELDTVLSNLSQFPHLRHISVEFPFDYDGEWWESKSQDYFDPSHERALAEEAENAWLGLMASSFTSLVSNSPVHIRSLEIHHLNIAEISTFTSPEFPRFLSQLQSFNLSIRPWDNGVGWHLNTQQNFDGFADRLGPWFTEHLSSVEEFTLDPSNSSVLGNALQPYCHDISLRNSHMPSLRKLTLRNIIICVELRDFIIRHLETIEEVSLHECYAITGWANDSDSEALTWLDLFAALSKACSSSPTAALQTLDLSYDKSQLEMLDLDDSWAEIQDLIAQAGEKLATQPRARAFFYADVDDKYGYRFRDTETNLARYLQGDDEMGYREFLAVLTLKARRVTGGRGGSVSEGEDKRGLKRRNSEVDGVQG